MKKLIKKLLYFIIIFFNFLYSTDRNLSHKSFVLREKINNIDLPRKNEVISFLKNNIKLIGGASIMIIILIIMYKNFYKVAFDLKLETPGKSVTEVEIKEIKNMIENDLQKELENFIACINLICQEYNRTKKEEAQENEEINEKISQEDVTFIESAIREFQEITENSFFKDEIRRNKEKDKNSKEETLKHTSIQGNNATDLIKYEACNLINSLNDQKNCIIRRSEALLKIIFTINQEEKRLFFLNKFQSGMGLLQFTKLKKFQDINIERLMQYVNSKVKFIKDDIKDAHDIKLKYENNIQYLHNLLSKKKTHELNLEEEQELFSFNNKKIINN